MRAIIKQRGGGERALPKTDGEQYADRELDERQAQRERADQRRRHDRRGEVSRHSVGELAEHGKAHEAMEQEVHTHRKPQQDAGKRAIEVHRPLLAANGVCNDAQLGKSRLAWEPAHNGWRWLTTAWSFTSSPRAPSITPACSRRDPGKEPLPRHPSRTVP